MSDSPYTAEPIAEGGSGETFELTPDEETAPRAAIAEADRGESVEGDDLLDELSR